MSRFEHIGTQFDRVRTGLNWNFDITDKFLSSQQSQIDKLIAEGDSSPQAAAASVGFDGTSYESLKSRLDGEFFQTLFNLSQKVSGETATDLQQQISNLVLNAGNDSTTLAEIAQSRGAHQTLGERTFELQEHTRKLANYLLADIKGQLQSGFYNANNGNFHPNDSRFFALRVPAGGATQFVFEFPADVTFRVVAMGGNNTFIRSRIERTGAFSVPSNTEWFAINLQMANGTSDDFTKFANVEELYKITIRKDVGVFHNVESHKQIIEDNILRVPKIESEERQDTQKQLQIGYYSTATGNYEVGENWWHFDFSVDKIRRFYIESPQTGTVRIGFFENGFFKDNKLISTNEVIEVPWWCDRFVINMKTADARPFGAGLTAFETLNGVSLKILMPTLSYQHLQEVIRDLQKGNGSNKTLRILSIGNSFSDDGFEHLYDIARSAGVNVIVGVLYRGGESLEGHWNNIQSGEVYNYRKWVPGTGRTNTPGFTIRDGVVDEPWDIITYQQVSGHSGRYETFQPYLNNIHSYVKGLARNSAVKYGLQMTWAYSSTSPHPSFANYDRDQMKMYKEITEAYKQAITEMDFDILIPTGTAIQNARTNPALNATADELTRDGYHLDMTTGRMVTGLTVFETLIAGQYKKDIDHDVTFLGGSTKSLVYFAKLAARNAALNPFKVTEI